jgi:hypothetical protein
MLKPSTRQNSLVKSTAATTASVNKDFKADGYTGFVAHLNVTAHAGTTPTLDIKFQDSPDGTTFTDIASGAFTQVTTTDGKQRLVVNNVARYCRAVVTLGGTTPSYTMTLDVSGIG